MKNDDFLIRKRRGVTLNIALILKKLYAVVRVLWIPTAPPLMDCPSVDTFVGEFAANGLVEQMRQALCSCSNLINERESRVRLFVLLRIR